MSDHRHTCLVCGVNLRCNDSQCKCPEDKSTPNCGAHSGCEMSKVMKKPVKSAGFGPVGAEFTATYGTSTFAIGDVPSCVPDSNGNTIQVIGTDGKTYGGSTWYRFRVIPAGVTV